jgi:hypothetical protein
MTLSSTRQGSGVGRGAEAGFTVVEFLVTTVLAAISAAFIFGIHSKLSLVQRSASTLVQSQQTLRAGVDYISRDLRSAGFRTSTFRSSAGLPAVSATTDLIAVSVRNNAFNTGADLLRIYYADNAALGQVVRGGAGWDPSGTVVTNIANFAVGDLVVATRLADPQTASGCVLKLTSIDPVSLRLGHNATGAPWNTSTNDQCSYLAPTWNDGATFFLKFVARAYRIRPGDPRGVLQVSPSGEFIADDWQNLVLGVVDMQVALRIYQQGDANDEDGDGDLEREWISADNMNTPGLPAANRDLLGVRLSLVTKNSAGEQSAASELPRVYDVTMPRQFNGMSDENTAAQVAQAAIDTSPYHGANTFRVGSIVVDMRNMGRGH